ncbi:translation initiation factor IF-2-like [Aquila chrysaetos chrysaetos]|uniref:translation initiation factor IF-2-like n=1 Tax=Aquila chrysaetos chrysaetos TaxID=223781 RepID=UPI0011770E8F|nr:translation initiation factor IF-2-like [Aquila chrysaetos chrysaetos]
MAAGEEGEEKACQGGSPPLLLGLSGRRLPLFSDQLHPEPDAPRPVGRFSSLRPSPPLPLTPLGHPEHPPVPSARRGEGSAPRARPTAASRRAVRQPAPGVTAILAAGGQPAPLPLGLSPASAGQGQGQGQAGHLLLPARPDPTRPDGCPNRPADWKVPTQGDTGSTSCAPQWPPKAGGEEVSSCRYRCWSLDGTQQPCREGGPGVARMGTGPSWWQRVARPCSCHSSCSHQCPSLPQCVAMLPPVAQLKRILLPL